MHHVHVVGCGSALFENLALSWRHRRASFEQSSFDCLPAAIERIRCAPPEWVVYCGRAAASSWDDRPTSFGDEPGHADLVARVAAEVGARLAVISSDRIFTGPRMFHDENEPAGEDAVAQNLHSLEQAVLSHGSDKHRALVVRTNAFGWTTAGDSFAERVWNALDSGKSIELSTTAFATPILASDLAELLLRSFRARLHGIVHLAGAERTSTFRFAQELAVSAGFDPQLVKAKNVEPDVGDAALSRETSLGSRLVRREVDVSLPLLRESLARFVEQATSGYRDQLRAASDGALSRAA